MDSFQPGIVVTFLTVIVAINLFLTLRLVDIVGDQAYLQSPIALRPGGVLPRFAGRKLEGGERLSTDNMANRPAVLLFLSPECKDCQARIVEILDMYDAIRRSGVTLWLVSSGSRRQLRKFLAETPLLQHAVMVRSATLRKLNPRSATPFYLFVDQEMTVLASNFIGDGDWQSFVDQMREIDRGEMEVL